MTLGDLEFKKEDFLDEENRPAGPSVISLGRIFNFDPIEQLEKLAENAAKRANRILRKKLEKAPIIVNTGIPVNMPLEEKECWVVGDISIGKQMGRVVCIEEIKNEPK